MSSFVGTPVLSPAPHEASAWLRERMAARVDAARPYRAARTTVIAPLGRTLATRDTPEDRTCDRCSTYVPVDQVFHGLLVRPVPWLLLIGGLCGSCAQREGVPGR